MSESSSNLEVEEVEYKESKAKKPRTRKTSKESNKKKIRRPMTRNMKIDKSKKGGTKKTKETTKKSKPIRKTRKDKESNDEEQTDSMNITLPKDIHYTQNGMDFSVMKINKRIIKDRSGSYGSDVSVSTPHEYEDVSISEDHSSMESEERKKYEVDIMKEEEDRNKGKDDDSSDSMIMKNLPDNTKNVSRIRRFIQQFHERNFFGILAAKCNNICNDQSIHRSNSISTPVMPIILSNDTQYDQNTVLTYNTMNTQPVLTTTPSVMDYGMIASNVEGGISNGMMMNTEQMNTMNDGAMNGFEMMQQGFINDYGVMPDSEMKPMSDESRRTRISSVMNGESNNTSSEQNDQDNDQRVNVSHGHLEEMDYNGFHIIKVTYNNNNN